MNGCEGGEEFGVVMLNVGEFGTELEEDGTDVPGEGLDNKELAAWVEGKGEVMRGIGEDELGEKGRVGD